MIGYVEECVRYDTCLRCGDDEEEADEAGDISVMLRYEITVKNVGVSMLSLNLEICSAV